MASSPSALSLLALALCAAPAASATHDDDGKVLDREARFVGPAFRSGVPRGPGGANLPALQFDSFNVQLLSWLPLDQFGTHSSANSCWGYVSASGREYAIIGLSGGTGFVEITDPTNPDVVQVISGPGSLWRDVKAYQGYGYAVSEGGSGIQVIDLRQIDSGLVTFVKSVTTGGTTATHTLALDETSGFLYRSGGQEWTRQLG